MLKSFSRRFLLNTVFPIAMLAQPASAVFGPSTTDYLIRLQALSYFSKVSDDLREVDNEQEVAKKNIEIALKNEEEKLNRLRNKLIKDSKKISETVEKERLTAEQAMQKEKGEKQEEMKAHLAKQQEHQKQLNEARGKLEADKNAWVWKSGITEEQVNQMQLELDAMNKAIEKLQEDLGKTTEFKPSADLNKQVMVAQMAQTGFSVRINQLRNSLRLLLEVSKGTFDKKREALKDAAVCMVQRASYCTERYASKIFSYTNYNDKSYDEIKGLKAELNKCAEANLKDASKATSSNAAPSCKGITVKSTPDNIADCIKDYRTNVLKKPERQNASANYDDCASKAPAIAQ